jgi:hypothetical protein
MTKNWGWASANGRLTTSRTHHKLLGLKGTIAGDGEVRITGDLWNTPLALDLVRAVACPTANFLKTTDPCVLMFCFFWWLLKERSNSSVTTAADSWPRSLCWPVRFKTVGDVGFQTAKLNWREVRKISTSSESSRSVCRRAATHKAWLVPRIVGSSSQGINLRRYA